MNAPLLPYLPHTHNALPTPLHTRTHTSQPPDQVPSDEEVRRIVHHVFLEDAIKLAQSRERYERLKELGLLF